VPLEVPMVCREFAPYTSIGEGDAHDNFSSNALASSRSAVSKPSVNHL
jgi:hypothetical protein